MSVLNETVMMAVDDQTKIFRLGQKMVRGDYLSRIRAEGELLSHIRTVVANIEKRKEIQAELEASAPGV